MVSWLEFVDARAKIWELMTVVLIKYDGEKRAIELPFFSITKENEVQSVPHCRGRRCSQAGT